MQKLIKQAQLKLFTVYSINLDEGGEIEIVGHIILFSFMWFFGFLGMFCLLVWLTLAEMNHIQLFIFSLVFIFLSILFLFFESKVIIKKNVLTIDFSFCEKLIQRDEYLFNIGDEFVIKRTGFSQGTARKAPTNFSSELRLRPSYKEITLIGVAYTYNINTLKDLQEYFFFCKKISKQLSINVVIDSRLLSLDGVYPIVIHVFGHEYESRDLN